MNFILTLPLNQIYILHLAQIRPLIALNQSCFGSIMGESWSQPVPAPIQVYRTFQLANLGITASFSGYAFQEAIDAPVYQEALLAPVQLLHRVGTLRLDQKPVSNHKSYRGLAPGIPARCYHGWSPSTFSLFSLNLNLFFYPLFLKQNQQIFQIFIQPGPLNPNLNRNPKIDLLAVQ